jgi:hypothetical protein
MEAPWDVASLRREVEEKTLDWRAFSGAREIIRARVLEVKDSKSQLTPLPQWSGTDAVLGSLDLSIHAMERTLLELHELLKTVEAEQPRLQVLEGGRVG